MDFSSCFLGCSIPLCRGKKKERASDREKAYEAVRQLFLKKARHEAHPTLSTRGPAMSKFGVIVSARYRSRRCERTILLDSTYW